MEHKKDKTQIEEHYFSPKMKNLKGIHPPENGWEENTFYIVDVAFSSYNIIHRAIFYTGFLDGKNNSPGGYNEVWSPDYRDRNSIHETYYMKAIRKFDIKT